VGGDLGAQRPVGYSPPKKERKTGQWPTACGEQTLSEAYILNSQNDLFHKIIHFALTHGNTHTNHYTVRVSTEKITSSGPKSTKSRNSDSSVYQDTNSRVFSILTVTLEFVDFNGAEV